MRYNIFILIIFTISSLALNGCDQIVDRSLGKVRKTENNESILTNKGSSLESLDSSSEKNTKTELGKKESITDESLSNDNRKELKKRYDVIGTNKDGPYRSGEPNRIRSTK